MKDIISLFKSPVKNQPLTIKGEKLTSSDGQEFEMDGRLLNFLPESINKNKATENAATYRWEHSNRLESDSGFIRQQLKDFLERYGFGNEQEFRDYLAGVNTIAEIGAGEGRMIDWFLKYSSATILGLELSDSVYYLKEKYKNEPRVFIIKADALNHPFADHSVDLLSCEQCIHHTDNPGEIFSSLAKSLSSDGKVLLSVYAKISPVREKFDVIIRDSIARLPAGNKMKISEQITAISKILSEMDVQVNVPELYLEFGDLCGKEMSLQRFLYYAVFKCFWNKDFTFEKSAEFNHDWYSYPVCNKTSLEEAAHWFISNKLIIEHVDSNPSNVNLRGKRRG